MTDNEKEYWINFLNDLITTIKEERIITMGAYIKDDSIIERTYRSSEIRVHRGPRTQTITLLYK
jgi:hypothetical protein